MNFALFPVYSQKYIEAVRIDEPPVIDGHVVEPVWEKADMVEEFYQREPDERREPEIFGEKPNMDLAIFLMVPAKTYS